VLSLLRFSAPIDTPLSNTPRSFSCTGGARSDATALTVFAYTRPHVAFRFDLLSRSRASPLQNIGKLGTPFKRYHMGTSVAWGTSACQAVTASSGIKCDFDNHRYHVTQRRSRRL